MARVTAEQRDARQQELNNIIFEIFVTHGWKAVTYQSIAELAYPNLDSKAAMKKKSSIQSYYKTHKHFGLALVGKVFQRIQTVVSECSNREEFEHVFINVIQNDFIVRQGIIMLLDDALERDTSDKSAQGLVRLINFTNGLIGEKEGRKAIEAVLGSAVVQLALE